MKRELMKITINYQDGTAEQFMRMGTPTPRGMEMITIRAQLEVFPKAWAHIEAKRERTAK